MKRTYLIVLIILIVGALALTILFIPRSKSDVVKTSPINDSVSSPTIEINRKYGLAVDSFCVIHDTIKSGSSLSDILRPYQVSLLQIDRIGHMSNDTLRVDRIKAGRPYAMFCNTDTSQGLKADLMVYEKNSIDYLIYDFRDSIQIYTGKKPVVYKENTVCGSIESSLWVSLKNKNANTSLALEMADIFGWVIDFFGIQKGDEFKIIYDEAWVEDKPIYVKKIKAGMMIHMGREYWAIPFIVDSVESFYELNGGSLRRTFLKAPLKFNRISSRFTNSRFHPILHKNTPHRAIDYSAPTGTEIRTVGDGVITLRRYGNGAGNYVKVKHNSVYTTVYMHMSRYGEYNVGDRVKQGDVIGYVGSTGLSTGPHLHFEVHKNGIQIDPLKLESPPAEPIPDSLMDAFNKEKAIWIEKINSIK